MHQARTKLEMKHEPSRNKCYTCTLINLAPAVSMYTQLFWSHGSPDHSHAGIRLLVLRDEGGPRMTFGVPLNDALRRRTV